MLSLRFQNILLYLHIYYSNMLNRYINIRKIKLSKHISETKRRANKKAELRQDFKKHTIT